MVIIVIRHCVFSILLATIITLQHSSAEQPKTSCEILRSGVGKILALGLATPNRTALVVRDSVHPHMGVYFLARDPFDHLFDENTTSQIELAENACVDVPKPAPPVPPTPVGERGWYFVNGKLSFGQDGRQVWYPINQETGAIEAVRHQRPEEGPIKGEARAFGINPIANVYLLARGGGQDGSVRLLFSRFEVENPTFKTVLTLPGAPSDDQYPCIRVEADLNLDGGYYNPHAHTLIVLDNKYPGQLILYKDPTDCHKDHPSDEEVSKAPLPWKRLKYSEAFKCVSAPPPAAPADAQEKKGGELKDILTMVGICVGLGLVVTAGVLLARKYKERQAKKAAGASLKGLKQGGKAGGGKQRSSSKSHNSTSSKIKSQSASSASQPSKTTASTKQGPPTKSSKSSKSIKAPASQQKAATGNR